MGDNFSYEDQMHGTIFVLCKRYVESLYDDSTWAKLLKAAGIEHASYQMQEMYPTSELFSLMAKASERTGIPLHQLLERFGEFLVPDLLLMYKRYLRPEWNTYDMLLNTVAGMHAAVREKNNRKSPPMLLVTKKGDTQLIVDYHSKRKMATFAVGAIKGLAKYYDEDDKVEVTLLTPVEKERVQIRVDFLS
ncbi:hypothetical protein DXT99_24665 [Pontibacter diazotrophicus]|uniref:Heme NO-binding domain-containing protein n=1 Tax=Pontibacter diazotrophicus TaxID=1400979 RepID=A0A3D8L268_9BACT|nr:heme NO-binding domain-containing protein [Pontibacter diazotrophicus]RDV11456.1 hypothetical protein DXT99_24665 [Pontibacter diazotrophicus]